MTKRYRIKSLREILNEFPGYTIYPNGNINHKEWEAPIRPPMLGYLGKEYDELPSVWRWDSSWYEVIEPVRREFWIWDGIRGGSWKELSPSFLDECGYQTDGLKHLLWRVYTQKRKRPGTKLVLDENNNIVEDE